MTQGLTQGGAAGLLRPAPPGNLPLAGRESAPPPL